MGLRELAKADTGAILEDGAFGFGWPITIKSPEGTTGDLVGFSDDISQIIDPDTGQVVSGRLASVVLSISTLKTKGFGLPVGIADASKKPWLVEFNDINGESFTFKVAQSNPDRAMGVVSCLVELYQ